ncbi:hypothetical protein BQ8794_10278 [Mesorhizobium prunaredense]|uniref:Uncharacterized protein n=1 Tax=Mesorhizobium prunaredense TaxID=1631249 RepID=A0A1R3UZ40_9HYPH|nr:hypothetical protein BQ8794_10278 [Mesorhizobium prunaredense]
MALSLAPWRIAVFVALQQTNVIRAANSTDHGYIRRCLQSQAEKRLDLDFAAGLHHFNIRRSASYAGPDCEEMT